MIRILDCALVDKEDIFARNNPTASVSDVVAEIIANVIENGDKALFDYAEKFDKVALTSLEVSKEEIDEAFALADKKFLEVLEEAAGNIRAFSVS